MPKTNRVPATRCFPLLNILENQKKLLEWKAEEEKKKNQEKLRKRPPFKVGIVHHRVYSPVTSINTLVANIKKKPMLQVHAKSDVKMGITKVTQKRLAQKAVYATKSTSPTLKTESFQKSKDDEIEVSVKNDKSFAPSNYKFKPPVLVANLPLFGKIPVADKLNPENNLRGCDEATEYLNESNASDTIETIRLEVSSDEREVSSCSQEERSSHGEKSTSRETSNAKQSSEVSSCITKEKKDSVKGIIFVSSSTEDDVRVEEEKSSSGTWQSLLSDKFSKSEETEMKRSNVSREEEEYTVQHFKHLLHMERKRLQKLCEKWAEVQSQDDTVEEARCLIGQAIGQTTLLLNEKFQQFRDLVLDCEKGGHVLPITCDDLHGFWDLMYIAVRDCDSRFARLKKLRASHWQEDEMESVKSLRLKSIAKKGRRLAKKGVAQTKQSVLRDFILAERRKKKVKEMRERKAMGTANDSWLIFETFGKCVTPSMSNLKFEVLESRLSASQNGRTLGKCSKSIYTSTPAHNRISTRTFHRFSTSLITMKINQLYNNKYTPQSERTVQYRAVNLTPRPVTIAELGESMKNVSTRSTSRLWRNDSLISKVLFDGELANISGELETDRDAGSSSKKVDNANVSKPRSVERILAEEKSNYYNSSEEDSTLKWLSPLNESEMRAEGENETSATSLHDSKDVILVEHISGRSRRDSSEKSPVRSSKNQTTSENVETPRATQSVANIFSTPRIARNFTPKKITLDRTDVSENHETSVKILRNRTINFIDTPKSGRRKKRVSFAILHVRVI